MEQQNHDEKSSVSISVSKRRDEAIDEANSILEIVGGNTRLDGFNLLGVIADPRAGGTYATSATSSGHGQPLSTPGRYNASSVGSDNSTASSSFFSSSPFGYFQSLEQTMSSVSESIGVFNNVLEDLSRSILEDTPTMGTSISNSGNSSIATTTALYAAFVNATTGSSADDNDAIPESQVKEIPPELENPTITAVKTYLQQSGAEAESFQKILLDSKNKNGLYSSSSKLLSTPSKVGEPQGDTKSSSNTPESKNPNNVDVSDIPPIFFDTQFDLTNPTTFCELLLQDKGSGIISKMISAPGRGEDMSSLDEIAITDLFPVLHPDSFNGYFDKVELALLEQVRDNSSQFLVESQRFAEIHQDIHALLDTVQDQKSIISTIQKDMIHTAEIIPQCDELRVDLRQLSHVLDRTNTLIQCKEGLSSIVSAHDDLHAISQIQHGRKLLLSSAHIDDYDIAIVDEEGTSELVPPNPIQSQDKTLIELGRLRSLKSVSDQFDQYEEFVVNNLRDELIEIFLAWNNHTSTTSSATPSFVGVMPRMVHDDVRSRVKDIIAALHSCNAVIKTKDSYQNRLQDMIRMTVRTTVTEFAYDTNAASNGIGTNPAATTLSSAATAMSLPRFLDCLDMLFEQILAVLTSSVNVDNFLAEEGIPFGENNLGTNRNGKESIVVHVPLATTTTPADTGTSSTEGTQVKGFHPIPMQNDTPLVSVLVSAAVLSSKSISELLRIRKEAHTLISLEEIKTIWDVCTDFSRQVEDLCNRASQISDANNTHTPTAFVHTSLLRSTLLAQTKAFVERKHESHMSSLVAALDSERWAQCEVNTERQTTLDRLCSGRAILIPSAIGGHASSFLTSDGAEVVTSVQGKQSDIEAEGVRYKVVWSCLLLIEMILTNIAVSGQFASLSTSCVSKVSELLRLFNSRTTHLVLGAGAIHSNARLKSINAKHLSLVTQCLGLMMAILPHVRAAFGSHMPKKQHTLLSTIDQIKKEYGEHNEKILNKFVSIIGGIVEHGLAKQLFGTDFDQRAIVAKTTVETMTDTSLSCCAFLEGVSTNTRKMHQVLWSLLPPDHLKDVFSRIFAYIDGKLPSLFLSAAETTEKQQQAVKVARKEGKSIPATNALFCFPKTIEGKRQLLLEIENATLQLNNLDGVHPWDFTARNVLERRLEYSLISKEYLQSSEMSVEPNDNINESNQAVEPNDYINESNQASETDSKVPSDVGESEDEKNDTESHIQSEDGEPLIASLPISKADTPDYAEDTAKRNSELSVNNETQPPTDDDENSKDDSIAESNISSSTARGSEVDAELVSPDISIVAETMPSLPVANGLHSE